MRCFLKISTKGQYLSSSSPWGLPPEELIEIYTEK